MTVDLQIRAQANAAFRFVVEIDNAKQAAFTECTLPVVEWEAEQVQEGGANTFVHQLPGRRKPATVSLKNGVGRCELLDWYFQTMSGEHTRKKVTITLLDVSREPVMVWSIADAFPLKWTGPQLKAADNTIAIQTLDLACGEIAVESSGS
jgi:phage tail-like protein